MKHEISVLGCGVIYIDNERVFGSKPYGLFSTVNWSATDEDLKRIADRCLELVADRKTEPQTDLAQALAAGKESILSLATKGKMAKRTERSGDREYRSAQRTIKIYFFIAFIIKKREREILTGFKEL